MNEDKYMKGEKCMSFSNDEIKNYLLDEIDTIDNIQIVLLNEIGNAIDGTTDQRIRTVVFDGEKEEFFINFYDHQTSLFFDNQEIMFIDDSIKNDYTSSDTYHNIVYEGNLRSKSHKEILNLFSKLIILISGYTKIEVEFIPVIEKNRPWYDYFDNIICIYGKNNLGQEYTVENLTLKFV